MLDDGAANDFCGFGGNGNLNGMVGADAMRGGLGVKSLVGGIRAGIRAATQFQSRADNIAQDADDRFIYRTTDQTVWFDADGRGAGAAAQIAGPQAGAAVTADDFLLD